MSTPIPEPMLPSETPLADQKLLAEIERLRLENQALGKPPWRNPATLVTLAGLLLSLAGNVQQARVAKRSSLESEREMQLSESRWSEEREKLRAEIEAFREARGNAAKERKEIEAELRQVKKDIATWDKALFDDQLLLIGKEASVMIYQDGSNPSRLEALKAEVSSIKATMEFKKSELARATARRTELEARLR